MSMCSIESIQRSSHSTRNNPFNRKISLKIIEQRLNHLREELNTLTKKDIINHENSTDQDDTHHVQYKKRFDQLLRLYEKQVGKYLSPNNIHWVEKLSVHCTNFFPFLLFDVTKGYLEASISSIL